MLEKVREYLSDWQAQGYAVKPAWYDDELDAKINALTNVELLEILDLFLEMKP